MSYYFVLSHSSVIDWGFEKDKSKLIAPSVIQAFRGRKRLMHSNYLLEGIFLNYKCLVELPVPVLIRRAVASADFILPPRIIHTTNKAYYLFGLLEVSAVKSGLVAPVSLCRGSL